MFNLGTLQENTQIKHRGTSQHIKNTFLHIEKRESQQTFKLKTDFKEIKASSVPKTKNRTHTEPFASQQHGPRKGFSRVKTDLTSMFWKLQQQFIPHIKSRDDFTKEEKLMLLSKKSNHRDYSAILILKHKNKGKQFQFNPRSCILRSSNDRKKVGPPPQLKESKKDNLGKRKNYKLLNMIGSKLPIYRMEECLRFNQSPMYLRSSTNDF